MGFSRRHLLAGAISAAVLSACGHKGQEASCSVTDLSTSERRLQFSNWPLYLDENGTLKEFIAKTGIDVTYTADINDNNEFYGKIRPQLAACQSIDRDIVVFSDWMVAKVIRQGFAQELSSPANLLPALKARNYDQELKYAVPWQSGLTGFAVNTTIAKPVHTMNELLTRPDLKGKVSVSTEMQDTMGLMIASIGKDPASFTDADFDNALAVLQKAVQSGQVRRFSGNDYVQELAKGDVAAAIAWSGDAIQLDNVEFIKPDEGFLIWSDAAIIPNVATHASNAQSLLDFYYDPMIAARVAAFVNYVCPVAGAQEAMERIDPKLADSKLIFPDAEMLKDVKAFAILPDDREKACQDKFQAVLGA